MLVGHINHFLSVTRSTYKGVGNDVNLRHGMTDNMLAAFGRVSTRWQQVVVQLPVHGLALVAGDKRAVSEHIDQFSFTTKRPSTGTHSGLGSHLRIRRDLWNWPAIQISLKQLFGPHAEPRIQDQRNGLLLVARSHSELIVVMPIGSGKSLLFVVPSQLPQAQVTIVIVSLIALRQDLLQRCQEWKIACMVYDPFLISQQSHAVPALLLVDIDNATSADF